jgi:hypothetical protein
VTASREGLCRISSAATPPNDRLDSSLSVRSSGDDLGDEMSSDLRERLTELADQAPSAVRERADLWQAGVRRRRRQRAAAVASVVATVLMVGGLGTHQLAGLPAPMPADAPESELHLPRSVHAPHPWTRGTDDTGPPGRLAAVSMATRHEADGLIGARQVLTPFGVSAVDGSSVFLDLPRTRDVDGSSQLGWGALTLSPDGRKVGYVHFEEETVTTEPGHSWLGGPVAGWDVYDTVTGEVTELRVPGMREIRGMDAFEIRFTGDSRHLLTNYSPTGSDGSRDDALVAWDVETGEPVEVEGTGHHWLPNPGSGPEGVVWARGRRILTFDPQTGETTAVSTPHDVVEASYGPDGRALAYVGHRPSNPNESVPWHLYAGTSAGQVRRVDLDFRGAAQLLGWRNEHEVVVGDFQRALRVVDVRTGEQESARLGRSTRLAMAPAYASDLWRNPLVDGVRSSADDPRWWLRPPAWTAGIVLGTLLALLVVRRRRAGA